ncbi:MAG: PorP/SprF family type IX secretion system membrane protein [Candidatus Cyclobacteriaceae bacterium M3_2C_046]
MYRIIQIIIVLWVITGNLAQAQDPQFSQFYAAPLYLNPAFAGSSGLARVGLNYRNQWPSLDANFVTYSAYFDYFFEDYNSGVGVLLLSDREGLAGLQSHSIGLQYSYQLRLTDYLTFRPGFQAAAVIRDINFNDLVFGSQIDPTRGFDPTLPSNEAGFNNSLFFMDLAAGGLFYSKAFWFGGAVHHLTEPNQSFSEDGESPLPMKVSFHGGYRFPLPMERNTSFLGTIREVSLTPTFQYKYQGQFDQLDVGLYFTYEPLVVGAWYRGIPFKTLEGFPNNESAIFLVGLSTNNLNIGYSFDYTVSELGIASGGAHELSLRYEFFLGDPRKPPKNVRRIPCPKF